MISGHEYKILLSHRKLTSKSISIFTRRHKYDSEVKAVKISTLYAEIMNWEKNCRSRVLIAFKPLYLVISSMNWTDCYLILLNKLKFSFLSDFELNALGVRCFLRVKSLLRFVFLTIRYSFLSTYFGYATFFVLGDIRFLLSANLWKSYLWYLALPERFSMN